MSREAFSIIPNALLGRLTSNEIALYVAIRSHYPNAWPSHATLAHEAGMSVSTVKRTLVSLREKNLLSWDLREGPQREQKSNVYHLVVDPPGHSDLPPRSERPTPQVTVTDEQEQENQSKRTRTKKNSRVPAGREEGEDMKAVRLPPDEPEEKASAGFERAPKEGTHKWLIYRFKQMVMEYVGGTCNVDPLHRTFRLLRSRGYTNAEIETLMDVFFLRHEQDIRARSRDRDVSLQFVGMLPRLERQASDLYYDFEQKGPRRAG